MALESARPGSVDCAGYPGEKQGSAVIRDAFAGRHVVLSGVTGFLGTAILERLLTDLEPATITCVARGQAEDRVAGLLLGSCFGPARERHGGDLLFERFKQRVNCVSADLTVGVPALPPDADIVIHAAATVSFDPEIDEAFQTNLLGSVRLFEASAPTPFLHVSTAYIAGVTRGTQAEELLGRGIDWRREAEHAVGLRDEVERESRRPEQLARFDAKARHEIGRAGPQNTALRTEELRVEWVERRLVTSGQARARSLGWPDAYAFTKALTEQALDELAGDRSLTIVRPSIIESAVKHPYPGWIEGFRVAEPVILAFGRGALPEFPGIPEGALDIIPVDMVVNCVLAAGAKQLAERPRRQVFHISSGARNTLRFRSLYEITKRYFEAHPLPERGRGSYKVSTWSFPGRRAVDRRLLQADRVVSFAETAVGRLPRTGRAREIADRVDRLRSRIDFVKRYADLYGHYLEVEVTYLDDRAQALFASLPADEQDEFGFDPTTFDWDTYLGEIHLPAVSAPMHAMAAIPKRPRPVVRLTERAAGAESGPVLAFFDVEGTIAACNVLETYLWLRQNEEDPAARARVVAKLVRKAPTYLSAERRDRGEFLRRFYRLYEGVDVAALTELAKNCMDDFFLRRLAPAAVRRIREHRAAGHEVILITGALDVLVGPLVPLADTIIAASLRERDGRYVGDLSAPPLVGEARASWLRRFAIDRGADLAACYAYADSMSDLPMLEAVGHPVPVNPDVALWRRAKKRRWPIESWTPSEGTPKILTPELVR